MHLPSYTNDSQTPHKIANSWMFNRHLKSSVWNQNLISYLARKTHTHICSCLFSPSQLRTQPFTLILRQKPWHHLWYLLPLALHI